MNNGDYDFKGFLLNIPPVTRTLVTSATVITVGASILGVIPLTACVLEWSPIISQFQIWRLLLTFVHMKAKGFQLLMRLYYLYTYSSQLERGTFFNRSANYCWFLFIVMTFTMLASVLTVPSYINGSALLLAIIHLWGRHANDVTVSLYGILKFPAKYLSLFILALDLLLDGHIDVSSVFGLVAGHLYYFLDSVYPTMPQGKHIISVPVWFENGIDQISDSLGSLLGLQNAPSAAPYSEDRTSQLGVSRNAAIGRGSGASAGSSARTGITSPSVRHSWGSGRTLGSE